MRTDMDTWFTEKEAKLIPKDNDAFVKAEDAKGEQFLIIAKIFSFYLFILPVPYQDSREWFDSTDNVRYNPRTAGRYSSLRIMLLVYWLPPNMYYVVDYVV